MNIQLYQHQIDALDKLKNGSILCGNTGSGKSRVAIAYFYKKVCLGNFKVNGEGRTSQMATPCNLYIITTAQKRDKHEWENECGPFCITLDPSVNPKGIKLTIDSWNNIKKYISIKNAFFIFDEQRVVGGGAWSDSFIKITQNNRWILLTATPGDNWADYFTVFKAHGFYRTKREFEARHCVYNRYSKYPKIDRYLDQTHLQKLRKEILVEMPDQRLTIPHKQTIICDYSKAMYKSIGDTKFNWEKGKPVRNISELCYLWRKVCNEDIDRLQKTLELIKKHPKIIIFYNFDYELELLKKLDWYDALPRTFAEWNGHKHEPIPDTDAWVYLVQYAAGAEGWNCTETNAMIFYSQSYSYKMTTQAEGRIDRINTPFIDLYYYYLRSNSPIDLAIARALKMKKDFNVKGFM